MDSFILVFFYIYFYSNSNLVASFIKLKNKIWETKIFPIKILSIKNMSQGGDFFRGADIFPWKKPS